jgi:nucleotide-binding universal stress UspA family protein
MDTYRRVFVAIDFTAGSDEALRNADQRAKTTGARLAVCHIVPNELRSNVLFPHISRITALRFTLQEKQIADAASTRVREISGREEGEFELIIDDGTPQALILDRAEDWLADLIVMGSHGQTSAADTLLGGVTESVLRHAHCPVLIARPGEQSHRIVVGTDFSDPALPALKAAAEEARRVNGELTIVHSLDLTWSPAAYPAMAFGGIPFDVSQDQINELQAIATERLEDSLKESNITGDPVVTIGPAGPALIQIAAERKADLVVVGTIGRTGLRRALLGSVAETVVKGASCSVLVVRRHPE